MNDYDAALWHFLRGFLRSNSRNVQIGIAARNIARFEEGKKRVQRFFPSIPINDCLCGMLWEQYLVLLNFNLKGHACPLLEYIIVDEGKEMMYFLVLN